MPDISNMLPNRQFFIHNCFGSLMSGFAGWLGSDMFYKRLEHRIISTFDGAVEYFERLRKNGGKECNAIITPSVNIDPRLDMEFNDGPGKFLWGRPNIAPGLAREQFPQVPGLEDQHIAITVGRTYFKGSFEATFWLASPYELFDLAMMVNLYTGGVDRYIEPIFVDTFIVVPQEIAEMEVRGKKIDWSKTPMSVRLLKAPNLPQYAFPERLKPMLKMTSVSDNSTKYANDSFAEYKLSISFSYEVALPTFLVVDQDVGRGIVYRLDMGGGFAVPNGAGSQPPTDEFQTDTLSGVTSAYKRLVSYNFYAFTEEDVAARLALPDPEAWVLETDIGDPVADPGMLKVQCSTGPLPHGDATCAGPCWWLDATGATMSVKGVVPALGDRVEMNRYEGV